MTPSRFLARAALAAWLLGPAGCSLALKTDSEQCTVDADCTARGAAFAGMVCTANVCGHQCTVDADCASHGANTVCTANVCVAPVADPKWGCIGNVQPLPSGGMASFKIQLLDLISNAPITQNLTIKLCSKYDPTCGSPLGAPSPDAMGWVSAMVASDFAGYLDITDTTGNYIPALVFIDLVAVSQNTDILLVPKSTEAGLANNAMVTLDPMGALLLTRTVDCTGARTAGVSVSMSPTGKETGFYVINSALLTTATQTDNAGNAGFINIAAPSTVTVTGSVAATGKEMGKLTTLVRPGGMTYQLLRPTANL